MAVADGPAHLAFDLNFFRQLAMIARVRRHAAARHGLNAHTRKEKLSYPGDSGCVDLDKEPMI